eukprot:759436-Hanusia_phi.AAC.2
MIRRMVARARRKEARRRRRLPAASTRSEDCSASCDLRHLGSAPSHLPCSPLPPTPTSPLARTPGCR